MSQVTFESFRDDKLKEGFDQALVKSWEPNFANEPHSHPFDSEVLIAQGEFWITIGESTAHFKAGETFSVARGVIHSEKYGSEGATFWAARKN